MYVELQFLLYYLFFKLLCALFLILQFSSSFFFLCFSFFFANRFLVLFLIEVSSEFWSFRLSRIPDCYFDTTWNEAFATFGTINHSYKIVTKRRTKLHRKGKVVLPLLRTRSSVTFTFTMLDSLDKKIVDLNFLS